MKVVTVVGTRPEIIRLSRVMAKLDGTLEHVVVHTGQNYDYELNQVFFDELELRQPDHYLNASGTTACDTIGNIISACRCAAEDGTAGCTAHTWRYQQLSVGLPCKTSKNTCFSYGGRKPLFRPTST